MTGILDGVRVLDFCRYIAGPYCALALRRIAARALQGGHDVPRRDVIGRFKRGRVNFETIYRPMAESWAVYDNSGVSPVLLEEKI
jgi:predicted ABC-type ATPase